MNTTASSFPLDIKHHLRISLILLIFGFSLSIAHGKQSLEIANEFLTSLENHLKLKKAEVNAIGGDSEENFTQRHAQLNREVAQSAEIAAIVRQHIIPTLKTDKIIDNTYFFQRLTSVTLPEDSKRLLEQLQDKISTDMEDEKTDVEQSLASLKRKIKNNLMTYKKTEDLDTILTEISSLEPRLNLVKINSINSQLSNYRAIVAKWQDYLAYLEANNYKQASYQINSLVSMLDRTPVVPRSQMIKLMQSLQNKDSSSVNVSEKVATITFRVTTQKELEKANEELLRLSKVKSSSTITRELEKTNALIKSIDLIQTGDADIALGILRDIRDGWTNTLKHKLMLDAVYMSIPHHYRKDLTPEPLNSLITDASTMMKKDKEWIQLWKFLKIVSSYIDEAAYTSKITSPSITSDINAIEKFIYAQRLEQSGQLINALQTYNSVLSHPGEHGPYEEAMKAIELIRTEKLSELEADSKMMKNSGINELPQSSHQSDRTHSRAMHSSSVKSSIAAEVEKKIAQLVTEEAANKNNRTKK